MLIINRLLLNTYIKLMFVYYVIEFSRYSINYFKNGTNLLFLVGF